MLGLRFALSTDLRKCSPYYTLGQRYVASYNVYKGKDSPRIVRAKSGGTTFFNFLEPTVPRLSLNDWKSPGDTTQTDLDDGASNKDDQPLDGDDYANMSPMALKIQQMWRKRYPVVLKRREYFSSPTGQAICYIQRICQAVVDLAPLHSTTRLRLRALLFSDGLKLYLFSDKIDRMYNECRARVKKAMDSADFNQIESAQVKWEKILDIQQTMAENTGFLAEKGWTQLPMVLNELHDNIHRAHKGLEYIEFRLRLLNPREREPAAAEAIQRAWRSQRQILKVRRDFRESEAGKTITYVHRIVKALNAHSPLDRKGEVRRGAVLFSQVVQLIQEVKRIERLFQKTKRAVRLRTNTASGEEKQFAKTLGTRLAQLRDWVRKDALFLSKDHWMELNVPTSDLEAKCAETWRVMRAVEYSLSRIMFPR